MTFVLNRLQVGDTITSVMDLAALPIGTVIGPQSDSGGERYRKSDPTHFTRVREYGTNRPLDFTNFDLNGYNAVISYPEGYVPAERVPESVQEYKWRFREYMLNARDRHGVSNSAVLTGLRLLGCDDAVMPLGAGLPIFAHRDVNRLVPGSLVYTGDPNVVDSFQVWQKTDTGSGWLLLLGDNPRAERSPDPANQGIVTIAAGSDGNPVTYDPPAWLASVTDEDIDTFKAKAWMVGMKTKAQEQWCPTAEAVLAGMGVTIDSLRAHKVNGFGRGDTVTPTQAFHLPVGTVFSYTTDRKKVLYQRVEDAPVRYGTRRVMAWRIDGSEDPDTGRANYASDGMVIEALPWPDREESQASLASYTDAELWRQVAWDALPVGSVVCYDQNNFYTKARDGRLLSCSADWADTRREVPERGSYQRNDFNLPQESTARRMLVVRFGV